MIQTRNQSLVPIAQTRRLVLQHPVFSTFADPYFRLSDPERLPVFVVQLDDREATLPIHAMMAEFGITSLDADGQMLLLVIQALNFVTGLAIGDLFPLEVLTGAASWDVDNLHRDMAVTRLNMHLLGRTMEDPEHALDKTALLQLARAPIGASELGAGMQRIADHLGDISAAEVLHRMDRLTDELAHIEALRDWLLRGVLRMDRVLARLARGFAGDYTQKEILAQIRRLTGKGIAEISACFELVDRTVADLATAIHNDDTTKALLRSQRDMLFRRWRAWEPYCQEWGVSGTRQDARTWQLANETYRFLAPRYMTIVEWRTKPAAPDQSGRTGMTW